MKKKKPKSQEALRKDADWEQTWRHGDKLKLKAEFEQEKSGVCVIVMKFLENDKLALYY